MQSPAFGKTLFICGLKQEARIVRGPRAVAVCGDASTLSRALDGLSGQAFRLVVSFGLCGGLDPAAASGDIVVASQVQGDIQYSTDSAIDAALAAALRASGERVHQGAIASVAAPILSRRAKRDLRRSTATVAVDMESGIAGAFAARHGLPLAVLRAVSDPADRELPPLVVNATTPSGAISYSAVALGLARSPAQLPALMAAGRDSAAAFRTLRRCYGSFARLFLGLGGANLR